jgi:ABC-type branched-subunit amino acid transport system substrate-binding protein
LLAAAIAVLLVGCAGGPDHGATDAEWETYRSVTSQAKQNPAEAEQLFKDFLNNNPESSLADDAVAQLAGLALREADEEKAMNWLYLIVRKYPRENNADRARVLLAGMEARAGERLDARRLLSKVRFSNLTSAERRVGYRLFADLSDDPVDRLEWQVKERLAVLEQLQDADFQSSVLGGGLEDLERDLVGSIDALSDENLVRAVRRLRGELPAGRVRLVLARRALKRGDFTEANNRFQAVDASTLMTQDETLYEEVALALELRARIVDGGGEMPSFADVAAMPMPNLKNASGVIGVVLPLTGRFAKYGEESLKGIMAAVGVFNAASLASPQTALQTGDVLEEQSPEGERQKPQLRLVIRDSEGVPATASLAIESLAAEEGLVAIIGPLLGDTSEAAARVADELEVPMLALTSREAVPENRSYVFRLRTTPRDEIRTLVDYAANELGAKRYAILYPKDNYGRGMRDHFWDAVAERGGAVVASSGYESDATDFAKPIKSMIGFSLLTSGEREALERRETLLRRARRLDPTDARLVRDTAYAIPGPEGDPLPPQVDFDVLFVPDSHEKIVLIAPQLTFHEIGKVSLMGPSGWNDPELLKIGRKHVRGAVISALFHEQSRFPFVREFVADYSETFNESPDVFAAHGYDAARLVMTQLVTGADGREEVRNGILRTQGFAGVSGVINMGPDGNAQKRPFLLKVRGGRMISLD